MKRTPIITIPLITMKNRKGIFWPAAFFVYFSYTLSGYNPFFDPWHPFVTSFDIMLPFIPETVWIYLSYVGMLFTTWWWSTQGPGCTRMFWAIVLSSVIATIYFLFFPTQIPRITLNAVDADPATRAAWAFLLAADKPTNCFPSLHVAEATLAAIGLARASPRWAPWGTVWAAAIILTTMTTRQHVLIDVLGGLGLALICWWLVEKFVAVEGEARQPGGVRNLSHG